MGYAIFVLALLPVFSAQAGELKLEFHGKGLSGQAIRVAVYNSREQFGTEDKVYKSAVVVAESDIVTVTIADVATGKYAVAAYADANGNGMQDRNFLGKPTELYGFSNDARGMLGPPDYAEALFEVGAGVTMQSVHLQ